MRHRTVFILGAGASSEAGAPLMRDFLDVADTIRDGLSAGPLRDQFELVFKAIAELQAVFAKSVLNLDNIESVFAAFEMADLFGRLGTIKEAELHALTSAIKSLIVTTLEERVMFPMDEQKRRVHPPRPYNQFAQIIKRMREVPSTVITVMTFNYELALDHAFHFNLMPLNYCLSAKDTAGACAVLKLHGSLNWSRCANCANIYATEMDELLQGLRWFDEVPDVRLRLSQHLGQCKSCGVASTPEPLIIPPTWNKTQHYAEIKNVWSVAAQHLSEAENIVVIGYSFPETDHFFHYLYALGSVSAIRVKRFWIINPDPAIRSRFEPLLGPLAKERVSVDHVPFSAGINLLRQAFIRE